MVYIPDQSNACKPGLWARNYLLSLSKIVWSNLKFISCALTCGVYSFNPDQQCKHQSGVSSKQNNLHSIVLITLGGYPCLCRFPVVIYSFSYFRSWFDQWFVFKEYCFINKLCFNLQNFLPDLSVLVWGLNQTVRLKIMGCS